MNRLPRRALSIAVKLFLASLAVGLALTFFDLTPQEVLEGAGVTAVEAFEIGEDFVRWSWGYVLLGAVFVIPIWVFRLWWRRRR